MRPGPAIRLLTLLVLAGAVPWAASPMNAGPRETWSVVAVDAPACPGDQQGPPPARLQPPPPASQQPPPAAPAPLQALPAGTETPPSESLLGVPVYPNAVFLRSFDAGRGQRFYLYGSTASFADLVGYYRSVLRTRGDVVFEEPATHMFEAGRFREETMAFPPGVTIRDHTWGGLGGYLNPVPGGQPARFPTVIQIVPVPPGERREP